MYFAIGTIILGLICQLIGIYNNKNRWITNGFMIQSLPFLVAVLYNL